MGWHTSGLARDIIVVAGVLVALGAILGAGLMWLIMKI